MITEKRLLKISGKYTLVAIAATLFFWFVIFGMGVCHAQTQTGYRVPAGYDCGNGARVTSRMNFQVGTGSTFVMRYGTTTITGSGSTGYMSGTDSAYPRWVWTPATGRMNFLDITLQQNGVDIAAYGNSAALAAALSDETGTNTVVFSSGSTQTNATFTGNSNFPGSGIWNSSGNVGIGTTTPGSRLSVSGGTSIGANYGVAAPTNGLIVEGNVGIGTVSPGAKLDVDSGTRSASVIGLQIRTSSGTGADGDQLLLNFYQQATGVSRLASGIGSVITSAGGFNAGLNFFTTNGAVTAEKMRIDNSGNVGIGVTSVSNILTLPVSSATDPIADAWTVHCLEDYKEIGTETTQMIQSSANEKIKSVPVSVFTKKAMISDEEAERESKQKYQDKIKESAKADLELYTAETGVAMQDNSYVDELLESMWETKADKIAIVEVNKQNLIAEKKALPKFQRKNYGIVAEDAPPEAQVLREDGSLQGVDPSVLIGILWANAQKQEARIAALESEITNLKQRLQSAGIP